MRANGSQPNNRRGHSRPSGIAVGFALLVGILLGGAAMRVWIRPPQPARPPSTEQETGAPASAEAPPPPPPVAKVSPELPMEPSADEMAEVLEDNRLLREQLTDLLHWILTNFQGHVPLPEPLVARMDLPVLDETGVLHPDLQSFLRISPTEREAVNRALATARDAVAYLRRSGLRAEFPDARRMIAHFPAFPEQGEEVRDRLYADLDAVLGLYRFDRMLLATRSDMQRSFDHFGLSERWIEFAVVASAGPGSERLHIRDEVRIPEDDGSIRIQAREISARDVPTDYRFLFETSGD